MKFRNKKIIVSLLLLSIISAAIILLLKGIQAKNFYLLENNYSIADESTLFYEENPIQEKWTPTKKDIDDSKPAFLECIWEKSPFLYINLDKNDVQYFAFFENENKILLASFARRDNDIIAEHLIVEILHSFTWGNYNYRFFQVKINPEENRCLSLYVLPFRTPHPESPAAKVDFSFAPEDIVVFTDSTPFYSDGRKEQKWTPTKEEVAIAEGILIECTEEKTLGLRGVLDRYRIQYFPLIKGGEKIVMINAVVKSSSRKEGWLKERITPFIQDGTGYEWFQTELNLEEGKCNGIYARPKSLSDGNIY